jgi:hypothetical protein
MIKLIDKTIKEALLGGIFEIYVIGVLQVLEIMSNGIENLTGDLHRHYEHPGNKSLKLASVLRWQNTSAQR